MSRQSAAAINQNLTAFAQGHAQDIASALAEFLCPTVTVPGAAGQYKVFNDANAFSVYDTARAIGGDARRIGFDASDAFYNCQPQALEVTVDQAERDLAGNFPNAQMLLDQGKVKALVNAQVLASDKKVLDYIIANTTAVADRGNWSNKDVDPIDQLDEQITALAQATGSASNLRMAIDIGSWSTLRQHPKVKGRCTGVQITGITLDQLKAALIVPVDIRLGVLVSRTVKAPSGTTTKANVMGSNVIITFAVPSPTLYDPSGFKCFTMGAGRVAGVRTYQPESQRYDVHALDWSEDIKQTSTLATKRLAIS